jgi:hypothetical protein
MPVNPNLYSQDDSNGIIKSSLTPTELMDYVNERVSVKSLQPSATLIEYHKTPQKPSKNLARKKKPLTKNLVSG